MSERTKSTRRMCGCPGPLVMWHRTADGWVCDTCGTEVARRKKATA